MQEFNNFPIVLPVLYAILVYAFLWGGKKIVLQWAKGKKYRKKIAFYLPLVQCFVWGLFAIYALVIFSQWLHFSMVAGLVGVAIFLGRQFLQNFFTGILFRLEKDDLQGVTLLTDTTEGVLFSYGMTSLCLKLANGNYLYVPYERLYRNGFVQRTKAERSEVQTIKVFVPKDQQISEENLSQLYKKILLNPYIVANKKVHLTCQEDTEQKWISLTYTLVNTQQAEIVKKDFESKIKYLATKN